MVNEDARIQRADRASAALAEFIDPAFDIAAAAYLSRVSDIVASEPWATEKVKALMTAARVLAEVRNQVASLVADGEVAAKEIIRVDRIEKISPAKRRILGL